MCMPPTMLTGGLVGHTIAKANEPAQESSTVNNYYPPQTEQSEPVEQSNKSSLKTSKTQTSKY